MKVAIPVSQKTVSEHFGRCDGFLVVTIEGDELVSRSFTNAPPHQPGLLPGLLSEMGVDCLIAGGIGRRAQGYMAQMGIQVYSGVSGPVEDVLSRFLAGNIKSGGVICEGGKGTCGH